MPFHVFHHHNCVIHDQPDRKHDREQCEQVECETEKLHEEKRADKRDRNGNHGHDHRPERPEEQQDHEHDDEQRLDQSFHDFVDRVVDVRGRVVGNLSGHAGRKFLLDLFHLGAHAFDHVNRVRIRQNPDAHEHGPLAREPHFGVVIFRAENDVGDVAQPNEISFVLAHDEVLEVLSRVQIRVRSQIYLKQRTFRAPDRG